MEPATVMLDDVEGLRQRRCQYGHARMPLAVSGPRGVACVIAGNRRALLYDLVEDDEEMTDSDPPSPD